MVLTVVLASILPASTYASNSDGADQNGTEELSRLDTLNWVEGRDQTIDVGSNLASLKLKKGYYFLDQKDTIVYLEETGNIPNGNEIGTILPKDDSWALFLEYEETGHIEDEEKSDIDPEALLDSYRQGTEEANKKLDPKYHLTILGWHSEPHYDESIHSLTWATLLKNSDNYKMVNYNTRILTRIGTISTVLVSAPESLAKDSATVQADIIDHITLKDGNKYSDFDPKIDKMAAYGLTGLILGGAGAVVAKKTGLLAVILAFLKKGFVFIIAAFVWIGRLIFGKRKKNDSQTEMFDEDPIVTENHNQSESTQDDRFNQSDDRFNSDNRFK